MKKGRSTRKPKTQRRFPTLELKLKYLHRLSLAGKRHRTRECHQCGSRHARRRGPGPTVQI